MTDRKVLYEKTGDMNIKINYGHNTIKVYDYDLKEDVLEYKIKHIYDEAAGITIYSDEKAVSVGSSSFSLSSIYLKSVFITLSTDEEGEFININLEFK